MCNLCPYNIDQFVSVFTFIYALFIYNTDEVESNSFVRMTNTIYLFIY